MVSSARTGCRRQNMGGTFLFSREGASGRQGPGIVGTQIIITHSSQLRLYICWRAFDASPASCSLGIA
jgi:hypothetical protein